MRDAPVKTTTSRVQVQLRSERSRYRWSDISTRDV